MAPAFRAQSSKARVAGSVLPAPRVPAWLFWNILCLDAPAVAVSWYLLASRVMGIPISLTRAVVLGTAVWLIYMGDHLLDVRGAERPDEPARHRWVRRHRAGCLALMAGALVAIVAELRLVPMLTVQAGLALSAIVAAYFALVHALGSRWRWPREFVVGMVFAAGSLLPVFGAPDAQTGVLVCAWLLLSSVCVLNCALVEVRESESRSRVHAATQWVAEHGVALGVVIGAATGVFAVSAPKYWWFGLAAVSSAAMLAVLARIQWRISREAFRVMADLALLSPLLFVSR